MSLLLQIFLLFWFVLVRKYIILLIYNLHGGFSSFFSATVFLFTRLRVVFGSEILLLLPPLVVPFLLISLYSFTKAKGKLYLNLRYLHNHHHYDLSYHLLAYYNYLNVTFFTHIQEILVYLLSFYLPIASLRCCTVFLGQLNYLQEITLNLHKVV